MLHSTALGRMAEVGIQHGVEATAEHLTRTLRQKAHAAGWPADVCLGMSVVHDGDAFTVTHHPATEAKALDLEYGTQKQPPNAVIRPFNNRVDSHADGVLGAALMAHAERWL